MSNDLDHGFITLTPPPPDKKQEIPEISPPPPVEELETPKATIMFLPPEPVIGNLDILETPPPNVDEIEGKTI